MRSAYPIVDGKIINSQCEINIVEHCNLACRACSHLSPVMPRHEVEPEALERTLTILGRHYHARQVKLLGGEPLLHRRLLEVVSAVRRSAIADEIALVTNGLLLAQMPFAFWQAIDSISVSMYPRNARLHDQVSSWQEKADAASVKLYVEPIESFQESYSELGTSDRNLVARIYRACDLAHVWRCHTVADGYFWKCPQSYFLAKLAAADGGSMEHGDGVRIDDSDELRSRLVRYMTSPEPLAVCRHCLGSSGRTLSHAQTSRRSFREIQSRPTEALVDYRKLAPRLVRRLRARRERLLLARRERLPR
jgi:organic radical activating enzyme